MGIRMTSSNTSDCNMLMDSTGEFEQPFQFTYLFGRYSSSTHPASAEQIVVEGSGHGIPLPFAPSLASDVLFVISQSLSRPSIHQAQVDRQSW